MKGRQSIAYQSIAANQTSGDLLIIPNESTFLSRSIQGYLEATLTSLSQMRAPLYIRHVMQGGLQRVIWFDELNIVADFRAGRSQPPRRQLQHALGAQHNL